MSTRLLSESTSMRVRIPMEMKRRCGRKEIIMPCISGVVTSQHDYQEQFVIALARGHRWQEMLDSGEYRSIRQMAKELGVCATYMSRLIRLTLLAPDIVEAILRGDEPSGLSLNEFTKAIPLDWSEQRKLYGFGENRKPQTGQS